MILMVNVIDLNHKLQDVINFSFIYTKFTLNLYYKCQPQFLI